MPAPPGLAGAVVAFTGCIYVAADVDRDEVLVQLGPDLLSSPSQPAFLAWLATAVDGVALNNEVVLAGIGTGTPDGSLEPFPEWRDHERAGHGAVRRRDVSGWIRSDGGGVVLVGRGMVDRWEVAYEVEPGAPAGTGRALAAAALGLVPAGEPVFAQVAPGHAQSLRAALGAGFRPIGGEVLIIEAHE
ncbi:MAG: GNAT family N-acetyltransferase [Acidimicrobiia bacterium]